MEGCGHYFLIAITKCWFARPVCFKTHSHHLQAKLEWYFEQVGCLFLGGCRPRHQANETTVAETEQLGARALFRGARVTRHTLLGGHSVPKVIGTAPKTLWPWVTHTVLRTQRNKAAKPITSRATRNLLIQAAETITRTQSPVLPITSSECNPWWKTAKLRWGGVRIDVCASACLFVWALLLLNTQISYGRFVLVGNKTSKMPWP